MSLEANFRYPDLESAIEGTLAPVEIISQLDLVPVEYINFDSEHVIGQVVVASILAEGIQEIFGAIRDAKFLLKSVIPIVAFGHEDHLSIAANNTSAFCYRLVSGTDHLSRHSYGRAIDLNPLLNPYVNSDGSPRMGSFPYKGYDLSAVGTILEGGAVVRAFTDHGWEWGGHWSDSLDYQHFNKD